MDVNGKRRVLITGATGFLGRYFFKHLAEAGWAITGALRGDIGRPLPFPMRRVNVGTIGRHTDWTAAMAGVEAVVHLAGMAHIPARRQERLSSLYFEVNAAGTERLARAAVGAGVKQFLFVSSIAVNGACTGEHTCFKPSDVPAPSTVYGDSKARAEEALHRAVEGSGMRVAIVRPPLIYGRDPKGSLARLKRCIDLGLPLPFGAIRNCRAFAGADNVASFAAHWLEATGQGVGTFIVADEEQCSTPCFVRRVAESARRRAVLLPVPASAINFAMRAAGLEERSESILGSLKVDTSEALRTGWRPVTMREGLAEAFGACS